MGGCTLANLILHETLKGLVDDESFNIDSSDIKLSVNGVDVDMVKYSENLQAMFDTEVSKKSAVLKNKLLKISENLSGVIEKLD